MERAERFIAHLIDSLYFMLGLRISPKLRQHDSLAIWVTQCRKSTDSRTENILKTLLFFASAMVGIASPQTADAQGTAGPGADFFGIYIQKVLVGRRPMEPDTEPDAIPYTAQGRRAFDEHDPELDPRSLDDCATDPMPRILWTPDPVEIREEDGMLVIHFERGSVIRPVVMDGTAPAASQPNTHLGYSAGRWEGDVLIIETTHMSGGVLSGNGWPVSPNGRVTERYWREPGSNDLLMELEIDDPVNYTEPFTLGRTFIWAPHEEIRPWVCVSLGPNDVPPDLDELTRMLEEL